MGFAANERHHEELIVVEKDHSLIIFTERSNWSLYDGIYIRSPRNDRNGMEDLTIQNAIDGRLDDNTEHQYKYARWIKFGEEWKINIKPVVGPIDGYGILTGIVTGFDYLVSMVSVGLDDS